MGVFSYSCVYIFNIIGKQKHLKVSLGIKEPIKMNLLNI